MNKAALTQQGIARVVEFCLANDWDIPFFGGSVPGRLSCGLYDKETLYVTPEACANLGYGGPAWSWPGYVIDRTPFGVYAHELGHYAEDLLDRPARRVRRASGEDRLTNYCPNDSEWWAEMFRLFVTNSDLLRCVRPKTFAILRSMMIPYEVRPWREVLQGAPARTLSMAAYKSVIS